MSTIETPAALEHPELAAADATKPDDALAEVTTLGARYRDDRSDLETAIRTAISAGATEKAVTEASGLANMTIRRILGKPTYSKPSSSATKKPKGKS